MSDSFEFDYVIVGAGSAGCVLANRLSADPNTTVCLIEAGPTDRNPLIHVPLGMASLFRHRELNWRFETTPQANAGNRSIYTPRGRVLGGSSAINGMVYMRGHPHDYDDWARAGNTGWSFAEVLPYFIRSECNEIWRDSPFHGTHGPLHVTDLGSCNPIAQTFVDAAVGLGLPRCSDFNGPDPEGVGYRQVTQRAGKRESSATAFLSPVRSRSNLCVWTDSLVHRLSLQGKRATGVVVERASTRINVIARREVLLCAGAIGSPQLLMRSGIGESSHLREHGIDVVHHLRGVGANLQDHAAASVSYACKSTIPYGISIRAFPRLAWSALEYLTTRRGLFASNVLEAAAYIRSDPTADRPDIQFSFMSARRGGPSRRGSPSTQFGWGHGFGITAILLRPESRGSIRLASSAATDPPLIDPAFFSAARDLQVLVRGLQLARRVLAQPNFAPYEGQEISPGRRIQTDEAVSDFVRHNSGVAFHPVGTCAMGTSADAVVDPQLAVHGIGRLRVMDASVMPTIVTGNTNAPTIMIAEKGADILAGRTAIATSHC